MPMPSRRNDIEVQGSPGYRLGEGPFWRGVAPRGWWHAKAALAADFRAARYVLGDRDRPLATLLTTVRSSAHLLADAGGVFHGFGPDALATLPGVGAYIGRQVAPLIPDNADVSTSRWTSAYAGTTKTKLAGTRLGIFSRVQYGANGASYHRLSSAAFAPAAVVPHFVTIYWEPGSSGRIHVEHTNNGGIHIVDGTPGNVTGAVFSGSPGTFGGIGDVPTGDGITRRLSYVWTPAATTTSRLEIGPGSDISGQTIIVCGADIQPAGFETPFIPSSGTTVSTRQASDVRAASFDWFDAAGLQSGFSVLGAIFISHPSDTVFRTVFSLDDGTASNRVRLFVNDAGAFQVQSVRAGSSVYTGSGIPISSGRNVFAFRLDAGGCRVKLKGGGLIDTAFQKPLGIGNFSIGSQLSTSYLNDTVERIEVCRPLTNEEMDAWLEAA